MIFTDSIVTHQRSSALAINWIAIKWAEIEPFGWRSWQNEQKKKFCRHTMRFLVSVWTVAKQQFNSNGSNNDEKSKVSQRARMRTRHMFSLHFDHIFTSIRFLCVFNTKMYRRWQFSKCMHFIQSTKEMKRRRFTKGASFDHLRQQWASNAFKCVWRYGGFVFD